MSPQYVVIGYFFLLNLAAFLAMGLDKQKSRRGAWRIPERTFFLTALLGGSVGCLLGMTTFRHKTKHAKFVIGMPAILILQITAILFIITV